MKNKVLPYQQQILDILDKCGKDTKLIINPFPNRKTFFNNLENIKKAYFKSILEGAEPNPKETFQGIGNRYN